MTTKNMLTFLQKMAVAKFIDGLVEEHPDFVGKYWRYKDPEHSDEWVAEQMGDFVCTPANVVPIRKEMYGNLAPTPKSKANAGVMTAMIEMATRIETLESFQGKQEERINALSEGVAVDDKLLTEQRLQIRSLTGKVQILIQAAQQPSMKLRLKALAPLKSSLIDAEKDNEAEH